MTDNEKKRRASKNPNALRKVALMMARHTLIGVHIPMGKLKDLLSLTVSDLQVAYPVEKMKSGELECPAEYQVAVEVLRDVKISLERIEGLLDRQA